MWRVLCSFHKLNSVLPREKSVLRASGTFSAKYGNDKQREVFVSDDMNEDTREEENNTLQHKDNMAAKRKSSQFKSPLMKKTEPIKANNVDEAKLEIAELKKQLKETNEEISILRNMGLKESELKIHIEKLHDYNEMKDVGQMLLGRLAILENVCTKDLYERYGLNLED